MWNPPVCVFIYMLKKQSPCHAMVFSNVLILNTSQIEDGLEWRLICRKRLVLATYLSNERLIPLIGFIDNLELELFVFETVYQLSNKFAMV
jgi:hypothetical protein